MVAPAIIMKTNLKCRHQEYKLSKRWNLLKYELANVVNQHYLAIQIKTNKEILISTRSNKINWLF